MPLDSSKHQYGRSTRTRLAPDDRRKQLLAVASKLLTEHGVDRLQITEVAAAAGVTRPVIYRFFDNRQALIVGVLEDFESEVNKRFFHEGLRGITGDLAESAQVFVGVVCDTIESKGAGPWHLLGSKGPDSEIATVAGQIMSRMIEPWVPRIADITGASDREVSTLAHVIVAAGRAVLDLWLDGTATRDEAVRDATRAISALIRGFMV